MKPLVGTLVLVLALVLAACAPQAATPVATEAPATEAPAATEELVIPDTAAQTIVDLAVADGRFSTLVGALQSAGLAETLAGEGPFTVFAPTDEAFANLPAGTLESLTPEQLESILLYHVVAGKVMAADAAALDSAETLAGQSLAIQAGGGSVMINDAEVIIPDLEASNGVIHVIDSVLLPPAEEAQADDAMAAADIVDTAIADGRFTTLVAAVQAAGLVDALKAEGPFTVFAPTDEAFAALGEETINGLLANPEELANILLYHVVDGKVMAADVVNLDSAETLAGLPVEISVDGSSVMINGAEVIVTDVEASNGVIHVIDSVLLPLAEEAQSEDAMAAADIVDIAIADGRFTTLVAAVEAAGLVDTLKGEGPFTVFAPTDEAFAALGEDTINDLLANPEELANILLYHVVPGEVMAADVLELNGALVDTALEGAPVAVSIDGDQVMINGANVIITDVEASNGVIHVLDAVILPPAQDIVDTAIADGRFTTLVAAVEAAGLVETLKGEGPFTVFAPTDEAFAVLGEETINSLLQDPEQLADILLYHVIPGKVSAADAVQLDGAEAETALEGAGIAFTVADGAVMLNDNVMVIITNVLATNGVIHVIDGVLLPPQ